ncbi:MAG TPA: outer membrane protein assembly factor BamE [Gammaproteobacteria bacterium]|nr:outer membrane protein assembly factor BamE [Gammaproteobacteria bacterium]
MYSLIRVLMLSLFTLACLGLTACPFPPRIYRIDVRQGNYITTEMTNKLKVGMTKESVRELMGTPALTRFFEQERWDYYYSLKPGNGEPIQRKAIILFFKGNHVVRIEKDIESKEPEF